MSLALANALRTVQQHSAYLARNKIESYFPDRGPFRRELYPKHTRFFELGKQYRERLMLAANRIGKTESIGGYELTLHLTGDYPPWWPGRRFKHPTRTWACGTTSKTVREILQRKLLGPTGSYGTGLIPGSRISDVRVAHGVADSIDTVYVQHATGGLSELVFKSYDQRRRAFEGTDQHVILLDEEPPLGIYIEALMRTMTCDGLLMGTFTPLLGISDVVKMFLPDAGSELTNKSRVLVTATWDDVPHLSESAKASLLASIPPYQRDARTKGIPYLGAGAIYQVPEADIVVPAFELPKHWPRAYALDVGWNRTAALWGALDRETDTLYLYTEHYMANEQPVVHSHAIKAKGDWINGVIDPAARGRSQDDGARLVDKYVELGLHLTYADNAVESGIYSVWERLSAGRLKVFANCKNWLDEYRLYRRDENGKIVKENDHLMDDTRYLVMSGIEHMRTQPVAKKPAGEAYRGPHAWMG